MQSYNNPNQPPPSYPNQPPQPPYQGGPGYPNQAPPPYPTYGGPPPPPPRRRGGRIWLWLLGVVMVIIILAVVGAVTGAVKFSGSVSVTDGSTPTQTSVAGTANPTSGSTSTTTTGNPTSGSTSTSSGNATVTDMTMAKGFDGDNAVNPGSTFSPNDNPLYGVAKVANAKANTQVKGSFIAVDAGGEKGTEILTKELTVQTDGPQVINFQLSLPRPWPTGKYRFDLYLDGQLAKSVNYEIK